MKRERFSNRRDSLMSAPKVVQKNPKSEFEKRRRQRSLVTALLLGAMVILFFFIAVAKIARGG